jgi:hypothetical protein
MARILLIIVILSLLASRSITTGVPRMALSRDIASASGNALDVNVPAMSSFSEKLWLFVPSRRFFGIEGSKTFCTTHADVPALPDRAR